MEVRRLGTIVVTMKKDFIKVYINKSDFWKILSEIEEAVKIFSIPNKIFQKNSILLCALRIHISKILFVFMKTYKEYFYYYYFFVSQKKKKKPSHKKQKRGFESQ